jgi:hypothetical protein
VRLEEGSRHTNTLKPVHTRLNSSRSTSVSHNAVLDHHLLFSFSSPSFRLRPPLTSSLSVSFSHPVGGVFLPPFFVSFFASSVEVSTFFLFSFHRCEGFCLFLDGLISFVGVVHKYIFWGAKGFLYQFGILLSKDL